MRRSCARVCLAALLLSGLMQGCAFSPAGGRVRPIQGISDRTWRDESIYLIMIDRFRDGDPTNDQGVNRSNPSTWHGGDLAGVIEKLDYIKSMGFTTIWITPFVKNSPTAYHGYHAVDFMATDPHFGTTDQVKTLVKQAHAKGLKVLFDVVVNHTGPDSPLLQEHPDWFHPHKDVTNWNDPNQVLNGWIFGLPDLDQSNDAVRQYILSYSRYWIKETGVDGFRLDTVRHVPVDFWNEYTQALQKVKPGFWMIGEDFETAPAALATYQKAGISAMLDFPVSMVARDVFGKDKSMTSLAGALDTMSKVMPDPTMLGDFLDNHDLSRFATYAVDDPVRRLELGLVFLFTGRDIPVVYYGTELALPGGNDPANRMDFPWDHENDYHPEVRSFIQKLNTIRRDHVALRRGTVANLAQDPWHYAYARSAAAEQAVVLLNNDPNKPWAAELDVTAAGLKDGTVLQDVLGAGQEATVTGGKLSVGVGPRSGAIYVVKHRG